MDTSRYADLFLTESQEHLSAINHALLDLERAPESSEPVNALFRAVHTIKGMSATMGYVQVAELAHALETLLDQLRIGSRQVTGEVVGEAETGLQAVEKYKQLRPDLVTMDIVMPDMGGIDAVREITKFYPNAKVLMCSAMGQQALVVEAIQAGAKDFVVKPFQPSRVLEAVQRVLG